MRPRLKCPISVASRLNLLSEKPLFGQRLRGDIPQVSIRSSHRPPVAYIDRAYVLFPFSVLQGKLAVMAVKYKRCYQQTGTP